MFNDRPAAAEIDLDFPIKIRGRAVSTLTMRPPQAPDFFKFPTGAEASRGAALLAHLCGVRPRDLAELAPSDLTKVAGRFQSFMSAWL